MKNCTNITEPAAVRISEVKYYFQVHPLLEKVGEQPTAPINHKKRVIVKVGVNLYISLIKGRKTSEDGWLEVQDLSSSKDHLPSKTPYLYVLKSRKGIHASGSWTMLVTHNWVLTFVLINYDHIEIPTKGETPAGALAEDKREYRIITPFVANAYVGRTWTYIAGINHITARDTNGEY
ncbi:hypothetical protein KIN20_030166 [Parelaphostrongylus tenuis]|uniref:Uncharacterized protein n=1 Tax=Parelaphostrongylus tenuis TaxID=148309 RepID=A0AAD5WG36_PARTN|nr:hypothetical protein KIN20_030166 [Parelaphostrongylus tenuis]